MIRTNKMLPGRKRFGEIMAKLRRKAGLSQSQLLGLFRGVSPQSLSNLERGVGGNWPNHIIALVFQKNHMATEVAIDLINKINTVTYAYEFGVIDFNIAKKLLSQIPVPTPNPYSPGEKPNE